MDIKSTNTKYVYIAIENHQQIIKFSYNDSIKNVIAYQLIDYIKEHYQHLIKLDWTYSTNIYNAYIITAYDNFSNQKLYEHDEPIMDQCVWLKRNNRYHKNCDDLIEIDTEFLLQFEEIIRDQESVYQKRINHVKQLFKSELGFQYKIFGPRIKNNALIIREWFPQINKLELIINFESTNQKSYSFIKETEDCWLIQLSLKEIRLNVTGREIDYRYYIETFSGERLYKMSPYTKRYVQYNSFSLTNSFKSFIDLNTNDYEWKYDHIDTKQNLKIYETHIGISQLEKKIGSYQEFTKNTLPYIKKVGYNCIQLMGILEHPHYSTFGYQPNFIYAPSSRFGSASDLKDLIDTAHGLGIKVILDVITGHSCSNENDGLSNINGIINCFFKSEKHPLWKCEMFDFGIEHVFNYLLSALVYWIEEYKIDGFRFDAVTAILFKDFGAHKNAFELGKDFFTDNVYSDGLMFLRFTNKWLHEKYPFIVTIAEDVSGYPGLCSEFYLGFDYQLGMHIPDIIQKCFPVDYHNKPIFTYDNFNIDMIAEYFIKHNQTPLITYVESHDQAFVGGCTLFHALAGKSATIPKCLASGPYTKRRLEVKIAMQYSMIFRLLTYSVSGQGYMTFMGNEFGHPQWIEFPSMENNLSFDKCHRKWNLTRNKRMIFQHLLQYEKDLHKLADLNNWLSTLQYRLIYTNNEKQILIYKQLHQIFVINFHTTKGYNTLYIPIITQGNYKISHSTQENQYGGSNRIKKGTVFKSKPVDSKLMRDSRLSRAFEKKYNEDFYLHVTIEPLCGYILELIR